MLLFFSIPRIGKKKEKNAVVLTYILKKFSYFKEVILNGNIFRSYFYGVQNF